MPSASETILQALAVTVATGMPAGVEVVRNVSVPGRVPPGGWVCVRDGDPGPPEVLISPPHYIYDHLAEIDVVVDIDDEAQREAQFDRIKLAIGQALALDRTLGGLCDYVVAEAPAPVWLPVEGAEAMKAATIGVVLTYGLPDPLS